MRNLLSAGLKRLRRSRALWLSCAVMAGMEIFTVLGAVQDMQKTGRYSSIDDAYFVFPALVGFLSALVCVFLIGPEYSDGAIRNKLVTGHRRRDVYLSNLLLSCLAALVMCFAAVVPALALGLSLLGPFQMGAVRAAACTVGIVALSLAFASVFTLLAMLVDNRTVSSVLALILTLVLLMIGSYLYNRLDAPATIRGYELSVDGELVDTGVLPNPDYIPEGPVRELCEFLDIFLPGGQTAHYCDMDMSADRVGAMIASDAAILLITTALGLVLFRRKDLK